MVLVPQDGLRLPKIAAVDPTPEILLHLERGEEERGILFVEGLELTERYFPVPVLVDFVHNPLHANVVVEPIPVDLFHKLLQLFLVEPTTAVEIEQAKRELHQCFQLEGAVVPDRDGELSKIFG